MQGKVHLEVYPLVICEIARTYVILEGMIKQSLGLSSSCHLHWEIGIIRSFAEEMAPHLVEIDILIARDQRKICVATIVREEVSCIMLY